MKLRPLALSVVLATAAALTAATPSSAADEDTFAVLGDVPYGADQIAAFPSWIQQINADPDVSSVVHLGDIKNGSSLCSDSYFAMIRRDVDAFADPFVYTPGDNEWTDCHRQNNGAYNPLERLAKVREVFFDHPGTTLGQTSIAVQSQSRQGYPENVTYRRAGLTFVAADVPGSNNGLQPWSGIGYTKPTTAQRRAVQERTDLDIAELHQAFRSARANGDRGVVVLQQADMFDPTYSPTANDISAFAPWVQALIDEASHYAGPVYLFNGDSHAYNTDKPLATGSTWLRTYRPYGVTGSADNLTRITVDGSSNNKDWLKVHVNAPGSSSLLSWTRVPYID